MTYVTGGPIQALDYNTFATLTGGMNEVFADMHSGATTLPNAGFGYGQLPALVSVAAGDAVAASEWANLFDTMRTVGTHQGTTVVPPLPVSDPIIGDIIAAYNTPSTLTALAALLQTNRFNLAAGQSTIVTGSNFTQPAGAKPWTTSLTFTYQVDFGSWNNARYFFNSGGSLNLNGSYSPIVTPEDTQWAAMLTAMSPLVFNYASTTPNTGAGGTSLGFYNLTTSYQTLYQQAYGGGGYYTASYVQLEGKLSAAAGTNGLVDFRVKLVDADASPNSKTTTTVYHIDNKKSSGLVTYPGPAVVVSSVGANSGFTAV